MRLDELKRAGCQLKELIYVRSLSIILQRVDGLVRVTEAAFELLISISSATNVCSSASLIASPITKIGALFSLTSASSSGSKTRVMLVLLKSFKPIGKKI